VRHRVVSCATVLEIEQFPSRGFFWTFDCYIGKDIPSGFKVDILVPSVAINGIISVGDMGTQLQKLLIDLDGMRESLCANEGKEGDPADEDDQQLRKDHVWGKRACSH